MCKRMENLVLFYQDLVTKNNLSKETFQQNSNKKSKTQNKSKKHIYVCKRMENPVLFYQDLVTQNNLSKERFKQNSNQNPIKIQHKSKKYTYICIGKEKSSFIISGSGNKEISIHILLDDCCNREHLYNMLCHGICLLKSHFKYELIFCVLFLIQIRI